MDAARFFAPPTWLKPIIADPAPLVAADRMLTELLIAYERARTAVLRAPTEDRPRLGRVAGELLSRTKSCRRSSPRRLATT